MGVANQCLIFFKTVSLCQQQLLVGPPIFPDPETKHRNRRAGERVGIISVYETFDAKKSARNGQSCEQFHDYLPFCYVPDVSAGTIR